VSEVTKVVLEALQSDLVVNFDDHSEFAEAQLLNLDSTKAKFELGWYPKMSSTEAINITCQWYMKQNANICVEKLFQAQISKFFET
jgi:CDP-glucose 4,6-dehydratase